MTFSSQPKKFARAALGIVCALLLFAQQVGLAHSLWHAAQKIPQQAQALQDTGGTNAPASPHASRLCPLDAALGQVLGGAFLSAFSFAVTTTGSHARSSVSAYLASRDSPTPRSRGPPLLV
jgi:hypothetical protein